MSFFALILFFFNNMSYLLSIQGLLFCTTAIAYYVQSEYIRLLLQYSTVQYSIILIQGFDTAQRGSNPNPGFVPSVTMQAYMHISKQKLTNEIQLFNSKLIGCSTQAAPIKDTGALNDNSSRPICISPRPLCWSFALCRRQLN